MAVLWKRDDGVFKGICTEWNKALRKVWLLPYAYSARTCMLGPLDGQCYISNQLNVRFVTFYNHILKLPSLFIN